MRPQIITLTLCAAVLTAATIAGAHDAPGQERPNRKQTGFNCPVCDSPCINKAALQRNIRQRRLQNQDAQVFERSDRYGSSNARWRGNREYAAEHQPARRQQTGRFDIDGDGELSRAEKAARRAYRDAVKQEREAQPNRRPDPQPPVE